MEDISKYGSSTKRNRYTKCIQLRKVIFFSRVFQEKQYFEKILQRFFIYLFGLLVYAFVSH